MDKFKVGTNPAKEMILISKVVFGHQKVKIMGFFGKHIIR